MPCGCNATGKEAGCFIFRWGGSLKEYKEFLGDLQKRIDRLDRLDLRDKKYRFQSPEISMIALGSLDSEQVQLLDELVILKECGLTNRQAEESMGEGYKESRKVLSLYRNQYVQIEITMKQPQRVKPAGKPARQESSVEAYLMRLGHLKPDMTPHDVVGCCGGSGEAEE